MEWATIQGIMSVEKKDKQNWSSWEEIYSIFNYIKSELLMQPISVRIISLTTYGMGIEIYGVLKADMFDEIKQKLDEIVTNLRRLYNVEFTWITGG